MKKLLTKLSLSFACLISSLSAQEYCFPSDVTASAAGVCALDEDCSLSAIVGHLHLNQSSVKQKGWLYGVRGNINSYLNEVFYLGAEVGYQYGNLKGDSDIEQVNIVLDEVFVENTVKSKYSDFWVEGRIGAKLGSLGGYLTPYFVLGYEKEHNNFVSPSPLELKTSLGYGYLGCGAISQWFLMPNLSVGLNAKLKWMFNSQHKTSGHVDLEDKSFSCANCFHYTVEVPFTFYSAPNAIFALVPFYQYKNYDKHKFKLADTEKSTFSMWGTLLTFGITF